MSGLMSSEVHQQARELASSFDKGHEGIRCLVVEDFLNATAFQLLSAVFPLRDQDVDDFYDSHTEKLKRRIHPRRILEGEAADRLQQAISGEELLVWLRSVTGAHRLTLDEDMIGAGFHETLPGGMLGMHTDDFYLADMAAARRFNLIIYLNDEWDESWGGTLYVGPRDSWKRSGDHRKQEFLRVAPLPNRAFLFETSPGSLHGHPEAVQSANGTGRRSLSLWFYDPDYAVPHHRTMFVETTFPRRVNHWFYNHGVGWVLRQGRSSRGRRR